MASMCKNKKTLNVSGMTCPMPLIEIRSMIDVLSPGEQLDVIGDDPVFETTMRDFCRENNHTILSVSVDGRQVSMLIEK